MMKTVKKAEAQEVAEIMTMNIMKNVEIMMITEAMMIMGNAQSVKNAYLALMIANIAKI